MCATNSDCKGLTDVTVKWATPVSTPAGVFSSVALSKVTLHVPAGTKALYEAADVWKNFGTIVELSPIITFADANVKAICVANWDTNGDGELSEEEAASVTTLGDVFKNNKNITSFDELKLFTSLNIIEPLAFYGCSNLASITLPSSINSIQRSAFGDCSSLQAIIIPKNVVSVERQAFRYCSKLSSVTFEEEAKLQDIGNEVFSNCTSLTSVSFPNSISSSIGSSMFEGCKSLKNVILSDNVSSIGEKAFYECYELSDITIPSNVTSIGDNAFYNCSNLSNVTFGDNSKLETIGTAAFRFCGLLSIVIPQKVKSIGAWAFCRCDNLSSLVFETESQLGSLGQYAFYGIPITTLRLPKNVIEIGMAAFTDCTKLKIIEYEEGTINAVDPKIDALNILVNTIIIPSSVVSIDTESFSSFNALEDVYVRWESPLQITESLFKYTSYKTATLHVPTGTKALYEAADIWKNFGTIVEPTVMTTSVSLSSLSVTINAGATTTLTAIVLPDNATNKSISWSSSNEGVATVSAEGVVTAVSTGTATITATANDGSGVSASCEVTVLSPGNLYLNDFIGIAGTQVVMPVYMDNPIAICNLQFDITLPSGVEVYYAENDDEEMAYFISKGERAKSGHTIVINKRQTGQYRVVMSSTSNAVFKDTDKSLPIAYITLDISPSVTTGQIYDIQLSNVVLSNYDSQTGITTPIEAEDASAKMTVPNPISIIANSSEPAKGSVVISGSDYNKTAGTTTYGSSVTLTATPATGFRFVEWQEGGVTLSTDNPLVLSNITSARNISAYFAQSLFNVTFMVDDVEYSSGTQTYGNVIQTPQDPQKEGHTFIGWKNLTANMTVPANDVTFEAMFTINQYTVKFIADGNIVYEQAQDYNSEIVAPSAPAKAGYVFISWGDVLDRVPTNDVTYVADYALLGDIYTDSKLNVADLTSLVSIILEQTTSVSDRTFKMADIYVDNKINVADYTSLVGMILNASNAKPRSLESKPSSVETANAQFDMVLPDGLNVSEEDIAEALQNTSLGWDHSIAANLLSDGSIRFVIVSPENATMEDVLETISRIFVVSETQKGEVDVVLRNVVLSNNDNSNDEIAEMAGKLIFGTATDIKNIYYGVSERDDIYNLAGQKIGEKRKGINIINGKKVLTR